MLNYSTNIWLLSEEDIDSYVIMGGKIIYISEEIPSKYINHPAVVSAGSLLPPIESIHAELDNNMRLSASIYNMYLQQDITANKYISIILAAAFRNIPIGIVFGKDESNFQFPKVLIDFIYNNYGLVVGINGKVQSYIEYGYISRSISKLYCQDMVDYETFMWIHRNMPIDRYTLFKLINDINPIVKEKSEDAYNKYFMMVQESINKYGKVLFDPMVAI